jgi:hypothetical protein
MFDHSKNIRNSIQRDRNNIEIEAKLRTILTEAIASGKSDRTIPEIWKSVETRLKIKDSPCEANLDIGALRGRRGKTLHCGTSDNN